MARFSINVPVQPGWDDTFVTKDSPVGRDLSDRATRVQLAAKAQVGVKTGMLKQDITKNWITTAGGGLGISVGSTRSYALVHHDGARPHVITARNAKMLRFIGRDGRVHFAFSVNHPGTEPNRYLTDNLHLAGG